MSHFWLLWKIAKNHFTLLCKLKSGFLFQPNTVNDVFGWMGVLGGQQWPFSVKNWSWKGPFWGGPVCLGFLSRWLYKHKLNIMTFFSTKNTAKSGISREILPKRTLFGSYSRFAVPIPAKHPVYVYIYIYIYACCCVRKWGAFLRFNRSIMLPFMHSIMGCTESGASNPYFYSVSGGGGAPDQLFSRVREISGVISGHHAENEVVQSTFLLFIYGIFFWVG